MNTNLLNRISHLTVAPSHQCRNLVAFPIIGEDLPNPDHFMLEEALAEGFLTVEEVDQGGSVPELVVVNDSDRLVLLLEGEEVAGAKQNRVLNTSILLDKHSRTKVPVSCTEQGRWAYNSENFSHSGNIMSSKLRRRKSNSVTQSLKMQKGYASDQCEVWDSIAEIHAEAGTSSETGAMKDAFDKREKELDEYTKAVSETEENQVGLLVFIDGKPVGMDLFARPQSFAKVAQYLAKSYAMDAITSQQQENGETAEAEPEAADTVTIEEAAGFLTGLSDLKEDPFESVGIGEDYRYEGSDRNGTALLVEDTPLHAAFFSTADDEAMQADADEQSGGNEMEQTQQMQSPMTRRRRFFRRNED